jgi:hypothetical protein
MGRMRDNLAMYWPLPVGVALYGPIVWRYVAIGEWERHIASIAVGTLGFVSAVAADEVAEYTGRYGWTYESFWTYPPNWICVSGLLILVLVNLFGFQS